MKRFMLISLMSCMFVGQAFCIDEPVNSDDNSAVVAEGSKFSWGDYAKGAAHTSLNQARTGLKVGACTGAAALVSYPARFILGVYQQPDTFLSTYDVKSQVSGLMDSIRTIGSDVRSDANAAVLKSAKQCLRDLSVGNWRGDSVNELMQDTASKALSSIDSADDDIAALDVAEKALSNIWNDFHRHVKRFALNGMALSKKSFKDSLSETLAHCKNGDFWVYYLRDTLAFGALGFGLGFAGHMVYDFYKSGSEVYAQQKKGGAKAAWHCGALTSCAAILAAGAYSLYSHA